MNSIILPIKLAWQSLILHKGRTILTIIGIVIGIAAVIIVMSAGESLKGLVLGQMEAFGNDIIQVEPKVPSTARNSVDNATSMAQGVQITTLKLSDAQAGLKVPNIKDYYAGIFGQAVISFNEENKSISYLGVSPAFFEIDQSKMAQGRPFTNEEDNDLVKVAVLGNKVAEKLFGNGQPLGQSVKMGKNKFLVVGVLQEKGNYMGVMDFDNIIYLPIKTAQKIMLGVDYVMWITFQVKNTAYSDQTADDLTQLMRERHQIAKDNGDDFTVTTMAEATDMINSIFGGITLLLVAIAGISLIVGGVGIMNIMYVSVTERTFEIGLRKAIGAKKRQILWQFLSEAIAVTLAGGILGIIFGVVFSALTSLIAGQFGLVWDFILPPESIIIAFGFCGAVGLVFGYYPAQKAAKLDPISALRQHE